MMTRELTWLECHALARVFLQREKGFAILKDNFSRGMDSIDFIALDDTQTVIVFVEMRLRHESSYINKNPRSDFDKRRFEHLALAFLSKYPCLFNLEIRADQLNLSPIGDEKLTINYYSNIASISFE